MTETGDGTSDRGVVLEVGALVLLTLGSLVSWVGWVGGVLLLWTSNRWTRRDKLLGTLVLPGGLLPAWEFAHGPATTTCVVLGQGPAGRVDPGAGSCDAMPFPLPVMLLVQVVLVLAPLVTVALLGWRVRRTTG